MYTVEEFDKQKTKVLNYIMYKKRTKYEVKQKFEKVVPKDFLEDILEDLEENEYINDERYVRKSNKRIYEFKNFINKRNKI